MIGRDDRRRRSRACRTPRRWRSTAPTSRTCAAACRSRTSASSSASRAFGVFREIVADGGTVRGFVVPNAGGYSRSEVDGIVDQAKALGAAGLIWARRAEDGADHQLDHEGDGRGGRAAAARRDRRRQRRAAARRGRASPTPTSKLLGPAAADAGEEGRAARTRTSTRSLWVVDFPLLEWDAGGEALRRRCTTRSPRRSTRTSAKLEHRARRRRAPRPTTWC